MPAARQTLAIPKRLEDVPALPRSLSQLLGLSPVDEQYRHKVVRTVEIDPGMAAFAINLANSAMFGGLARVHSLDQAVMRVGTKRVVSLLIENQLVRTYSPKRASAAGLWQHALFTAIGARKLVSDLKVDGVDPEHAYLSGLFHDIGLMGLATLYTPEYEEIQASRAEAECELIDRETMKWGVDHSMIGVGMVAAWGLPPYLTQVIMDHHDTAPPKAVGLASVVRFADLVSDILLRAYGNVSRPMNPPQSAAILQSFGRHSADRPLMTGDPFHAFVEDVRSKTAQACTQLGISIAPKDE